MQLATKFMPSPWKLNVSGALLGSLRASLDRLGVDAVDLYQIHGPISLRGHAALAEALAAAHQQGLVRAVGVSNYSVKETRSIDAQLRKRGLRLATNQIEFSLLRRVPETGGLLATCAELGVVPLAYSPIGQGRLTGKYSAANPPPGKRGFSAHPMEVVDGVVAELRRIGEAQRRQTPSQVALNWIMAKGAVPIPGAKNRAQAEENAGALGWSLDADEVAALDRGRPARAPQPRATASGSTADRGRASRRNRADTTASTGKADNVARRRAPLHHQRPIGQRHDRVWPARLGRSCGRWWRGPARPPARRGAGRVPPRRRRRRRYGEEGEEAEGAAGPWPRGSSTTSWAWVAKIACRWRRRAGR